jgi:hypothetical protein
VTEVPMHDEALLEQIRAYIRQHRSTYTLEALRDRLIRDGAPPDAVGRVMVEMTEGPQPAVDSPYLGPAPSPPPSMAKKWSIKTIFAMILAVVIVNIAGICLTLYIAFSTDLAFLFWVFAIGAIVAEVVAVVKFSSRNRSVSLGLLLGIVATPIVVVLLLLGTCLYIISQYNP